MVLSGPGGKLELKQLPVPVPEPGEVLVRVSACGICRTDLHVLDGDIRDGNYPVVPGHQIVGEVVHAAADYGLPVGTRVGIPWLGHTCGDCPYCVAGQENLCDQAEFTGYQRQGGFAEYVTADANFCFALPQDYPDHQIAPLLCAGLIGYRALSMTRGARSLGFYGFGSAAHILTQLAKWQNKTVYAFTRPGDDQSQAFALHLGADWAGSSKDNPPGPIDAAIIFAPAGELVPLALSQVCKGGRVVCAGIHMSDIPSFPYADLWGERAIMSVANLTRNDAQAMLALAPRVPIRTTVKTYPLEQCPQALADLRKGAYQGAGVIVLD